MGKGSRPFCQQREIMIRVENVLFSFPAAGMGRNYLAAVADFDAFYISTQQELLMGMLNGNRVPICGKGHQGKGVGTHRHNLTAWIGSRRQGEKTVPLSLQPPANAFLTAT
jgi:hypothetical protein